MTPKSKKDHNNDSKYEEKLPFKIGQLYYKHGLFLTSYPTCAVSLAFMAILFCCYPLFNIPLPGTIPTKVILPYNSLSTSMNLFSINQTDHLEEPNDVVDDNNDKDTSSYSKPKNFLNIDTNKLYRLYNNFSSTSTLLITEPPFPWSRIDPYIYVQQILLKSVVLPWEKNLLLTDAFRGPLFEVFKLLEIINNHEDEQKTTLSNLCLHVENVKRPHKEVLFPEYNCLILSPANLWKQNIHDFNKDSSLLNTIFVHHNNQKTKVSTAEMLFGIKISDTGIKRYPMQNRPRIIQYAITLILRENNPEYLSSLQHKLQKLYPLHQNVDPVTVNDDQQSSVMYIYYPGEFNLVEFVPLCAAFGLLFIYIYFSIRKVEMIRSRFVLALSSVLTVIGSLVMSLGLCFFFGLTIWMQSKGVYPYLVILVGLENCLVLTKSVMTTDNKLDTKIRVAQGLSKEGWSITKNIMTEITILTAGLGTFVPVIQEFCIFAIVGLLADYFLQMLLFSTILGLNVKRVEVTAEVKQLPKMFNNTTTWNHTGSSTMTMKNSFDQKRYNVGNTNIINRSKSHPSQLSNLDKTDMSPNTSIKSQEKKIPKRLRVFNFWARTRFFQRGFMIWMVLWIGNIIYHSGVIENMFFIDKYNNNTVGTQQFTQTTPESAARTDAINSYESMVKNLSNIMMDYAKNVQWNSGTIKDENLEFNVTEKLNKLKHPAYEINGKLSNFHWASILKQYNISMSGRFVTILPTIKLSHVVPQEVALKIRNLNEKPPSTSKWNALASALDPLDLHDADNQEDLPPNLSIGNRPLYPKTPMEIVLTAFLCIVSVFVIAYTMIVMYRCICSRNYAEWRSSWNDSETIEIKSERVLEGFPIQVNGHKHNIECIVTDGNLIASSCLQGQLKIWDASNGDLVAEIDRVRYFEELQQYNNDKRLTSNSEENLIRPQSQRSHVTLTQNDNVKSQIRLRSAIKFDFSAPAAAPSPSSSFNKESLSCHQINGSSPKSDFQLSYEKYFQSDSNDLVNDGNCNNTNSNVINKTNVQRSNSLNNNNDTDSDNVRSSENITKSTISLDTKSQYYSSSPIWSLDFIDNLIVIGCADGRIEFWEGTTGYFKCIYETDSGNSSGVTHIKLAGDRVIAARLSGRIDFLRLETYTQGRHIDWNFTSAYRRTHVRTGSAGSITTQQQNQQQKGNHPIQQEELRCILESQHHGHQQPITCLDVLGNILFTGSQDHTLKVFHIESNSLHYTLHGHCSPITALFIDQFQSGMGCSGSQDGLLCMWDLLTGMCMYNLQAHEDCVVSLACAPSYIISLGLDERLRVWERFQGHLMNTINVNHAYTNLLMLTPSLLVTGKPGALLVWDVKEGKPAHEVKLDRSEFRQISPKIMLPSYGSVICDYGNQLRIVRFPLVTTKCE
ncbi:unnamed protein product [Diamesa tonsa]